MCRLLGIECMLALKAYENAVNWCNEGLAIAELLEADKLRLEIFKTQAQKLQVTSMIMFNISY